MSKASAAVADNSAHLVEKYIAGWKKVGEYTKDLPVWSWVVFSMMAAGLTQSITGWLFSGNNRNPQHPAQRRAAAGAAPATAPK